jgi:membrane-bound lytic murein transglycosylase B
MKPFILAALSIVLFNSSNILAKPSWSEWVLTLKKEAVSQGIKADLFDQIFSGISGPDFSVLRFDRTQPEHRMTFVNYRNTRADFYKIVLGRREFQKHRQLLQDIGKHYRVDPCVIVALWGMETSYGHFTGDFPVIRSLATLAYDSRRSDHFRSELLYALQMVNANQISIEEYKGEWAGASGQSQFLPSSWFKYAEDYDGDGRKNIWTSYSDVFASIANYLAKNNWQQDEPLMLEVTLPSHFNKSLISKTVEKPVNAWNEMGVRTLTNDALPSSDVKASIGKLEGGPTFLTYPNFKVIMTYNNSSYYAATISYMADKICGR